jgi:hypothetical protein
LIYLFSYKYINMPKIAWAKPIFNAYNSIEEDDKVFTEEGVLVGTASTVRTRVTEKTPGSIQLNTGIWVSGDVEKLIDGWKITKNCVIS